MTLKGARDAQALLFLSGLSIRGLAPQAWHERQAGP
jgi:hypothetical protein